MTKEELIDKLFNEFEKDKELIKKNLILALNNVCLECSDKNLKIKMNIKIEREKENENINEEKI